MKTPSRSALACFLPLAALALGAAGCAGADEPEAWEAPPGSTPMGEFVAHINPKARSFTFERLPSRVAAEDGPGLEPQSFTEATITQDGVAGSGPVNTIELVNNGTPSTNAGCPAGFQSNTFCGNVTMRSFYTTTLNNVYLQATKVANTSDVDISGHSGVNSDGTIGTLSNALGLWKFTGTGAATGVLGPAGSGTNAGARDLIFANPDDATTKIYLHAYMTPTTGYSSYTMTATDGSAFIDASTASGGVKVLANGAGTATGTAALPFAFTFYDTTYASGSLVTFGRKGSFGFGSQAGTGDNAVNVALPNSGATTFHPGVFPFWDDLNYTTTAGSTSGVWKATSGSAPNRKFVLTWKTMKIFGDVNGDDNLTFSVILSEGTDRIDIAYNTMTSLTKQAQANGNSATIGVQNAAGTVATAISNTANSAGTNKGYTISPVP